MILKETILSAFTERGTLLKWLKKVEAALKDSVLTDISLQQLSETQIKLKFSFEGGDYVESPVLTLPRGEKGTKGDTGERGLGIDDISSITFDSVSAIQTLAEGIDIEGKFTTIIEDESYIIPARFLLPFKGSDSIIVDISEDGKYINIHLDYDIISKIERALLLPVNPVTDDVLVGIGTNNEQKSLKPAYPLMIEDDELVVDLPEWYLHRVRILIPESPDPDSHIYEISHSFVNEYKLPYSSITDITALHPISIPFINNDADIIEITGINADGLQQSLYNTILLGEYDDGTRKTVYGHGFTDADSYEGVIVRIPNIEIEDDVIPLK